MSPGSRLLEIALPLLITGGVLVTVAITFSALGGPTQVLVAVDSSGEEIVTTAVDEDTEIVLEYTHSVEQTLVRDIYVPIDGHLVMVRMEFSSFGAGLPSEADVVVQNGRYVYEPPNVSYETLRIQTGMTADHDLVVGQDRFDIAGLSDGGSVELSIQDRRRIFT